jgi:hypothetical protein
LTPKLPDRIIKTAACVREVGYGDVVIRLLAIIGKRVAHPRGIAGLAVEQIRTGLPIFATPTSRILLPSRPSRAREDAMEGETMSKLEAKRFETPDEVRPFTAHGHIDLVQLTTGAVGLATLEPGWKWSADVKPIAGTETCQVGHIGYCLSGRMGVRMEDGTVSEFGPGTAVHIPPGHDAWTAGDEPCVFLDFGGLTGYAQPTQ